MNSLNGSEIDRPSNEINKLDFHHFSIQREGEMSFSHPPLDDPSSVVMLSLNCVSEHKDITHNGGVDGAHTNTHNKPFVMHWS